MACFVIAAFCLAMRAVCARRCGMACVAVRVRAVANETCRAVCAEAAELAAMFWLTIRRSWETVRAVDAIGEIAAAVVWRATRGRMPQLATQAAATTTIANRY